MQNKGFIDSIILCATGASGVCLSLFYEIADIAQALTMIMGCVVMFISLLLAIKKYKKSLKDDE